MLMTLSLPFYLLFCFLFSPLLYDELPLGTDNELSDLTDGHITYRQGHYCVPLGVGGSLSPIFPDHYWQDACLQVVQAGWVHVTGGIVHQGGSGA